MEDQKLAVQSDEPEKRFAGKAVRLVGDLAGATAAGWHWLDQRGEPAGMIGYERHRTRVSLEEAHSMYVLEGARFDPFRVPVTEPKAAPEVVTNHDLGGYDAFVAAYPVFAKFLACVGLPYRAVMNLQVTGRYVAQVWVGRTEAEGDFDAEAARSLRNVHTFTQSMLTDGFTFRPSDNFRPDDLADSGLTSREIEVACLAAAGSTNSEIARALLISTATVKTHLHRAFVKLDIRTRTELAHHLHP